VWQRFWKPVLLRVPHLLWQSLARVDGGIAVVLFAVLLFNKSLAIRLMNWDGVDPRLAAIPVALLFLASLVRAISERYEADCHVSEIEVQVPPAALALHKRENASNCPHLLWLRDVHIKNYSPKGRLDADFSLVLSLRPNPTGRTECRLALDDRFFRPETERGFPARGRTWVSKNPHPIGPRTEETVSMGWLVLPEEVNDLLSEASWKDVVDLDGCRLEITDHWRPRAPALRVGIPGSLRHTL
jgi:hypothetical protein